LTLPEGITVTESTPAWLDLTDGTVTWAIGDLAPGAWKEVTIIFMVEPAEGEWGTEPLFVAAATEPLERLLAVRRTDGAFVDEYSDQPVSGQFAGPFWFNVWSAPRYVYLPVVTRAYNPPRPDLVVQDLSVDPAVPGALTLTLANVGGSTARNFWIDLYLDPEAPPEVNQPWTELCHPYGAAWFVEALPAGETLTLSIGDAYYQVDQSRWPDAYPAGEHEIWAYADSWGYPQPWGGVQEVEEANNRYGPVIFSVTSVRSGGNVDRTFTPIPPRPRIPEGSAR
jgi:hypothetical protein